MTPSASHSSLLFFGSLILAAARVHAAVLTEVAEDLLKNVDLPGDLQQTVIWTDLSNTNPGKTPVSGTGTIDTILAWQATAGFYYFAGTWGAILTKSDLSFDTQHVTLQLIEMKHPDYSFEEGLTVDPTNFPLPYFPWPGESGGPILSYNGGTQYLNATSWSILGPGIHAEVAPYQGWYYSYSWTWDLSGIADEITSISIVAPIIESQSTIGARLDVGGQSIPEPGSAALAGVAGLFLLTFRRRRRS